MLKRESGCPLCGAKMTAKDWLDAGTGLLDLDLGVLSAHCPYCQGYLELRPVSGRLEIGYLTDQGAPRFEVAMFLPWEDLVVERQEDSLVLQAPEGVWEFPI